jgi:putative transposase
VKKSRFGEEKIISILKQWEAGMKTAELARKHGVSEATLYNWKAKYGGLDVSQLRRLKELEHENARLKKMYAELSLAHNALQDAVEKKL